MASKIQHTVIYVVVMCVKYVLVIALGTVYAEIFAV